MPSTTSAPAKTSGFSLRTTTDSSFERTKSLLKEAWEILDDEQSGAELPTQSRLELLQEHAELSGKLNKLDQEKRNITGAVAYQFKCRKLEGRTKKLKEAVVFASKIAQMRVKAEDILLTPPQETPPHFVQDSPQPPQPSYPDVLQPYEIFWCEHFRWLQSCGYLLRKRYMPGWIPSFGPKSRGAGCEDAKYHLSPNIMDATRLRDGAQIMLKMIPKLPHTFEIPIGLMFSSLPLSTKSRNHCIPFLEILPSPLDSEVQIVVMPRLRTYSSPKFESIGELVELCRQIFEGVKFMHRNFIAHGDLSLDCILMDPSKLYPHGFHPVDIEKSLDYSGPAVVRSTRAECLPKYFIISFSKSRRFDPAKFTPDSTTSKETPFEKDIFDLGKSIGDTFLRGTGPYTLNALGFMLPLINSMVTSDPSKRPPIGEVVTRFDQTWRSLSTWTLRTPVLEEKVTGLSGLIRGMTLRGGAPRSRPTHARSYSAAPVVNIPPGSPAYSKPLPSRPSSSHGPNLGILKRPSILRNSRRPVSADGVGKSVPVVDWVAVKSAFIRRPSESSDIHAASATVPADETTALQLRASLDSVKKSVPVVDWAAVKSTFLKRPSDSSDIPAAAEVQCDAPGSRPSSANGLKKPIPVVDWAAVKSAFVKRPTSSDGPASAWRQGTGDPQVASSNRPSASTELDVSISPSSTARSAKKRKSRQPYQTHQDKVLPPIVSELLTGNGHANGSAHGSPALRAQIHPDLTLSSGLLSPSSSKRKHDRGRTLPLPPPPDPASPSAPAIQLLRVYNNTASTSEDHSHTSTSTEVYSPPGSHSGHYTPTNNKGKGKAKEDSSSVSHEHRERRHRDHRRPNRTLESASAVTSLESASMATDHRRRTHDRESSHHEKRTRHQHHHEHDHDTPQFDSMTSHPVHHSAISLASASGSSSDGGHRHDVRKRKDRMVSSPSY